MTAKKAAQGVQSLEKGVEVLRTLSEAGSSLRLSEVAAKNSMSRSKAHAYLTSLVRTGLAYQDEESGLYSIGEAAIHFGMSALRRLDILRIGRAVMSELHTTIPETSFLATWSQRGPLIVFKIENPSDSVFALQVGAPISFFPSASGRIFMAYLPQARWEHLLPKDIPKARLERDLEKMVKTTRAAGIASVDPVTLPSHSVLAAPVFDHEGGIRAAMCIVGPRGRFNRSIDGAAAKALRRAALKMSVQLGYEAQQSAGNSVSGTMSQPSSKR